MFPILQGACSPGCSRDRAEDQGQAGPVGSSLQGLETMTEEVLLAAAGVHLLGLPPGEAWRVTGGQRGYRVGGGQNRGQFLNMPQTLNWEEGRGNPVLVS